MTELDARNREAVQAAAEILLNARYTVVLAGAGISKESGIPTYRGEGGLWTIHGEPPLNQYQTFTQDPQRWWERRLEEAQQPGEFALALEAAQPNPGHLALAELEQLGLVRHLITQNVDDLHRRAGQQSLTEIHGNRFWLRCTACGLRWPGVEFPVDPTDLPPRCTDERCSGVVKSDTVMFGEPIAAEALLRSAEETDRCDAFITAGTSAVVYPAAQYPVEAVQAGAPLIEINPDETPLSELATVVIRAPSGVALPALIEAIHATRSERA